MGYTDNTQKEDAAPRERPLRPLPDTTHAMREQVMKKTTLACRQ